MGGARARPAVRVTRALAAVLSTLVVAGSGYGWAELRTLDSSVTTVAGIPDRTTAPGQPQNILLVGDDHRPADASAGELAELSTGEDGGSDNTDTMMLLHLPGDGSPATVVSLPRDSWVDIPGHGKGKLNSAFADGAAGGGGDAGGMRLLVRTIQNLTGLPVDHFVRISLVGFYDVAQVLGPVQVCLDEAVDDPYSGTDLPAGVSTLDAQQALSFVRQRHGLPRGDLDREVRQQYFLSVELAKATSTGVLLDPAKLTELLGAAGSAVQTDPGLDLLTLAADAPQLSGVTFTTVPVSGTPTILDGTGSRISVVQLDTAAFPAFFAALFGGPQVSGTTAPAAPSSATPSSATPSSATPSSPAPGGPPTSYTSASCIN